MLAASNRQVALALVNERLGDVAREADVGAAIPGMSARVALTAGTALALLAFLEGGRDPASGIRAGLTFAAGAVAAGVAMQIGRIARIRTRAQIESWNALVKMLTPSLPPSQ